MIAEWEPHAATWLVWPQNREDWPGKFVPVQWAYVEIVRALAGSEPVHILVGEESVEVRARSMLHRSGVDLSRVKFVHIPTDRGWARDMFPLFLRRTRQGDRALGAFKFNAWAKYHDFLLDAAVPGRLQKLLTLDLVEITWKGRHVVLEGGAIETNGRGTLITTEECLLDTRYQIRNQGFTREDYEELFREWFGIDSVIWLPGGIAGDDTHGHVDDICRFVSPDTVVLCREDDPEDVNHHVLERNRETLSTSRLADGSSLNIVELPMPGPLFFNGMRLPASYANFYISNTRVLVPTFNDRNDPQALSILAGLFPERKVVGIHSVDLIWGLGALHCLTHEQPA
ncbi:MAG: agmatine deiminase family protein [Desulfovibrionales bacterium]